MGWGDIDFSGNNIIKTPHNNFCAGQGITINRYSASALSSPERGSNVADRNPYRYGIPTVNAGHFKIEEITLPEL